jgi:hypothetical protein
VAVAEGGLRGQVLEYGRVANTSAALERLRPEYLVVDGVKLASAVAHSYSVGTTA